jgi:hypothetical protein
MARSKKKLKNKKPKPKNKKIKNNSKVVKNMDKKYPIDQFEDLNGWAEFYKENKKFPHQRILCGICHSGFASMKGLGMTKAFERCEGDVLRVLTETKCKECKDLEPKEKKPPKVLTQEEIEARAEEIRRNLPKINFHKERQVIDLTKDKDACAFYTQFACLRPDIYLDNDKTCDFCSINKYCACPIKKFSKNFKKK